MRDTPRSDPSTLGAVTQPTPDPTGQYPPQYQQPGYYQPYPLQPPQPPRRRGMSTGPILAIAIGSGVLALCLIGGVFAVLAPSDSSSPSASRPGAAETTSVPEPAKTTPAKGPKVVPLGQALTFSALGNEVVYILNPGPKLTKTKYGTGPEKGVFFAVSVAVEVKKGSTYACSCDVALVTKDGTVYEPDVSYGFDGALEAVSLNNAGQKAAGLIVWDLPASAIVGARVELRASIWADSDQYWQLP